MKTSNIILYSTAGLIFLAMISLSFRMRSNLKNQNVDMITQTYEISGFEQIEADGKLRLQIQKGSEFKIEFKSSEKDFKKKLELNMNGNLLQISLNKDYKPQERIKGTITLPTITSLDIDGETKVTLEGFPINQLHLKTLGKSHINLKDNQIDSLFAICKEKGSIDYRSGQARFAHLEFNNRTRSYFSGGVIGIVEGKLQDSAYVNFKTKTEKMNLELWDKATISRR
ncbi:MAG: GIN domain-containing protein [Marinifilaceae bacterium]